MNEENEIFNKKYIANDYSYQNFVNIFQRTFKKVHIDPELLEKLEIVFKESHNYKFRSYKDLTKFLHKMRKKLKYDIFVSKPKLFKHYRVLCEDKTIKPNNELEKFLKTKGARSRSGVISVTIFTAGHLMSGSVKNGGCPMDCHYCPFEKDKNGIPTQPRSYLSTEPGNMRATQNKHHPVGQIYDRLFTLENIGHVTADKNKASKIELIISGGTFNFYPKDYIYWFVTCAYYACNTYYNWKTLRNMKSLEEEKNENKTTSIRIIGLTIETRPDYIIPKIKNIYKYGMVIKKENIIQSILDGNISKTFIIDFSTIKLFREIGVTRVQIGIQTTKDNILKKINRGCINLENKLGIRLLKQNGFKTDIHIMLDLPGSSPECDIEVLNEIINSQDYSADQWKIYPTAITDFTKIKKWYHEGSYKPYAEDDTMGKAYKLMNVVKYALKNVPKYIRINRVVRDIPHKSIEGGLKFSNLRQIAKQEMDKEKIFCWDIREREIKMKNINFNDIQLNVDYYISSTGKEYFISYTSKNEKILYGFIRLRLNTQWYDVLPCLKNHALIRELHVYGIHTTIGSKKIGNSQHTGLGSKLLQKAEEIIIQNKFNKVAVISGVGVQNYYKKKGYTLGESDYMYKNLKYKIIYTKLKIILINLIIMFLLYCIHINTKKN